MFPDKLSNTKYENTNVYSMLANPNAFHLNVGKGPKL